MKRAKRGLLSFSLPVWRVEKVADLELYIYIHTVALLLIAEWGKEVVKILVIADYEVLCPITAIHPEEILLLPGWGGGAFKQPNRKGDC